MIGHKKVGTLQKNHSPLLPMSLAALVSQYFLGHKFTKVYKGNFVFISFIFVHII